VIIRRQSCLSQLFQTLEMLVNPFALTKLGLTLDLISSSARELDLYEW